MVELLYNSSIKTYYDLEEITMNLNKPMSIKHLLVASIAVIGISVSSTLTIVAKNGFLDDIDDLKIKNAATELRLTNSNLKRPTFEEVGTMMDERSAYNNASERHPTIDYSEDSNALVVEPEPEVVVAPPKPKPSIADTCDRQKNRLHWELFGEPAPGCDL